MMMWIGLLLIPVVLSVCPAGAQERPDATAVVDWTRTDGRVNRGLFSTQGFMQIYVEDDPMVMRTFLLTNPKDTHTRLETYIHKMEPENDDDDPNHFNWERFYPDRMIRFIEDREPFEAFLDEVGMDRLSLLCYNVPWLQSGDPDYPIRDVHEWAEFAAAVVQTYNGYGEDYRPTLRYVEVWNEPNMAEFYTGTMESYFDLFKATANRIHRDYPGVMVGGPALTHAPHCMPEEWMEAFLEECGALADFISYHHYGPQTEPVDVVIEDIKRWSARYRAIPGKEQGRIMITEIDAWFDGWPKIQHMLERQFRLLDVSDLVLSLHHFCCLAYRETGSYTFGIVDERGAVIEGTFWPYWLFRNLIGETAYFVKQGERQADFSLTASHSTEDEQWLGSAVFHNRSAAPLNLRTLLYFPPSEHDRILAFDKVSEDFRGVERVVRVSAGTDRLALSLRLTPGEGLALNLLEPDKRFFAFRDMNSQELPWMDLNPARNSMNFLEKNQLNVRILNTRFEPVSGTIEIHGLPEGWEVNLVSGSAAVDSLGFGETQTCRFEFTATTLVQPNRVAPYAVLTTAPGAQTLNLEQTAHSIPAAIEVHSPIVVQVLPLPVYAVPGEENQVTLQVLNQLNQTVEGGFEFRVPQGLMEGLSPRTYSIPAQQFRRYHFPLIIGRDVAPGTYTGSIVVSCHGSTLTETFKVEVVAGEPAASAHPMDLTPWLNLDVVTFFTNRTDYDSDYVGGFSYPGDYTPSNRVVRVRGVPYRMMSLEDGKKNVILPQGQRISVPERRYQGVAFMGYGHDGKHPGQWIFHYSDGTQQVVDSQIPEWCSPTPPGFEVAFNAPHRYVAGGPALPPCQLFTWTLETDPNRTLTAIELPTLEKAYLFAITLLE